MIPTAAVCVKPQKYWTKAKRAPAGLPLGARDDDPPLLRCLLAHSVPSCGAERNLPCFLEPEQGLNRVCECRAMQLEPLNHHATRSRLTAVDTAIALICLPQTPHLPMGLSGGIGAT